MKRVAVYIKEIAISDGMVLCTIPGVGSNYISVNNRDLDKEDWPFKISSDLMQPRQIYDLWCADTVRISTLTKNETDGTLFDLGETITTDKINSIRVRSFIPVPVYDYNKNYIIRGVAVVDLEY